MEELSQLQTVILMLAAVIVLVTIARRVLIPYPIFLVLGGLGWPAALALGAIVSPPDAVAAAAIARRLGIPHRVVTVLEGESLINDAAALVLYRSAVAAVVTGAFSLTDALWQFVLTSAGGVLIGLIVGGVVCWALRLTDDSLTETAITLLAPYAAWILAERTHTSGVLACV